MWKSLRFDWDSLLNEVLMEEMKNNMEGVEELWTVGEVAQKWRLKPSWIYQHIHEIPHLRLGRLLRFNPAGLDRYLKGIQQGSPAERRI